MDHYLKSGHGSKHLRPTKNNSYNDLIFTQPFTCRCTTRGASKKSKSNNGKSSSNSHGNNNGNSASGFDNDDNLSDSDIEDPKINMQNLNHPNNNSIHEDLDDSYDNHDKSDNNDSNSNGLIMAKVVSSNKPESEISFSAKRRRQTKVTVYQNPCLYKINIAFDLKNYRVIFKPFTDSIPHNHDQSVVDNMKYCNFVNSIIEEEARKGFSIEHIKKMLDYWKTILPDEIGLGSLKTAHIRNKRNKVLPSDHHHHHANASNDESGATNNANNNNDSVESKNDDATNGASLDAASLSQQQQQQQNQNHSHDDNAATDASNSPFSSKANTSTFATPTYQAAPNVHGQLDYTTQYSSHNSENKPLNQTDNQQNQNNSSYVSRDIDVKYNFNEGALPFNF
ncbi:unnamed protein product [[Candida] boidinii]|nr:unnamed protein product [[Candida] boidinii]GMF02316.1 unnamed protein product [[Candida] boidinii]